MPKTPEDALRLKRDRRVAVIEVRVADVRGNWHHLLIPPSELRPETFERGFNASVMVGSGLGPDPHASVVPDAATAFVDPFAPRPTLGMLGELRDPLTGQHSANDARGVAQRAETYLALIDMADSARFGLELDYSSALAKDELRDLNAQVAAALERMELPVDRCQSDCATGVQNIAFHPAPPTRMADTTLLYRYVVRTVLRRHGLASSSARKSPLSKPPRTMRVRQSLWVRGRPLFAGAGYAGSSALMRHYFAGLLEHTPALLAISALLGRDAKRRTTLSMHPGPCGFRSSAHDPEGQHVTFESTDPSCNPYLSFAAMLMAGIDGFRQRLYCFDPDERIDESRYREPWSGAKKNGRSVSGALRHWVDADHEFLMQGGVFTSNVIDKLTRHPAVRRSNHKTNGIVAAALNPRATP